ncbi:MAG: hypothetical protein P8P30_06455 [Rickettsiales bacterium]|nr:hypothetical protein [Rickettsiales bacterium]
MINNVANITTTALQNASKTLEVSANNVANIQSKGQVSGTQENGKPFVARRAESISRVEGGVSTKITQTNSPVNLEQEIVNQQFASYQFDASLKVLKEANETTGQLLDILA